MQQIKFLKNNTDKIILNLGKKGGGIIIKNRFLKRMIALMLIIMMIPSLIANFGGVVLADDVVSVEDVLDNWVGSMSKEQRQFYKFSYNNDGTNYEAYFMEIELPNESPSYPRIVYNYSSSGSISFSCQVEQEDSSIKSYPVKLNVLVKTSSGTEKETYQSILKRQAANNFNVDDDDEKIGYLLELANNVTSYEGSPIKMTLQVTTDDGVKHVKEFEIAGEGWQVRERFKTISQDTKSEDFFKKIWKWLTNTLGEVLNLLESLYNRLFLAVADGIFSAVCAAVGEQVTIDKVIFGKVGKLSINFWDGKTSGTNGSGAINGVMSVLKEPVNTWYNVFLSFAILVYLVALLIVGIKIVFASTGDAKAKYKETFQAWITGVIILFLYPYVMKYTVKINDVLVEMIASDLEDKNGNYEPYVPTPEVSEDKLDLISDSFGEDNFIASIRGTAFEPNGTSKRDMMLYVRELAGNLNKMSLTFVYIVLLGELIVILVVYYKRVFMMAFLITIFPIVALMYIVEKLISGSSRALGTWTKEYVILVLTQSFHAAVYVIVINAGINSYIQTDNWLFMLMCIIFLFQGEKILRSIFGMKSSANTIGDLAAAGMAGYGMIKSVPGLFKKEKQNDADEKDLEEADKKLHQADTSKGAQDAHRETTRADTVAQTASTDVNAEERNEPSEPEDVTNDSMANFSTAQTAVIAKALKNKEKGKGKGKRNGAVGAARKVTSGAVNLAGGALGGMVGAAAGLATGSAKKAAAGVVIGKSVGTGIANLAKMPIRGVSNVYHGRRLKKKILAGEMDQEFKDLGFDLSSMETEKQKIIREALANLGARTTTRGKDAGELKMLKTVDKMSKKKK